MRTDGTLKENLHAGFVVKTRNGATFMVVRVGAFYKHLASPSLNIPLKHYRNNLIGKPDKLDSGFDIMEIYGLIHATCNPYEALTISTKNRPMLWKRREEENNQ